MTTPGKTKRKFVIFAASYSPNTGGIVVLHRLCDLLNRFGYEAQIYPAFKNVLVNKNNLVRSIASILYSAFKFRFLRPFKTNPEFMTPVLTGGSPEINDDDVIIYSEGVFGNPLNARNVVRWLLHKPGFNFGACCFSNSELVFAYSQAYADGFSLPLCKLSDKLLYLPPTNLKHYNLIEALPPDKRQGIAYCLRKGRGKRLVHDSSSATLIDGLSHQEIAEIFKRVEIFISYDTRTAYSMFAALCGADSVVIPDEGVDIDSWEPEEAARYGIAYGFENIEWARATRPLVLEKIRSDVEQTEEKIHAFVKEINEFFSSA